MTASDIITLCGIIVEVIALLYTIVKDNKK